ncbi:hypothetical protein M9458_003302, partial [Cirrhinus mrigala]
GSVKRERICAWFPWQQSLSRFPRGLSWLVPNRPASQSTSSSVRWTSASCQMRMGKMHF